MPRVKLKPLTPASESMVRPVAFTVTAPSVYAPASMFTVSPAATKARAVATLFELFTKRLFALTVTRPRAALSPLSVTFDAMAKFAERVAVAPVAPPKVAVVASIAFALPASAM